MDKKISKEQLRRESLRRWLKIGIIVIIIAVSITIVLSCFEKTVKATDLRIATVATGEIETTVSASGQVVPARQEIINSPVSTRILEVYARPGDSVKAGTPLLELDLEEQQTEYDKLVDSRDISRQEQRQARLATKTLLSELAMQIEIKQMEVDKLKLEAANERRLDSLGSGTGEKVRQAETAYAAGVLELKQLREKLANEQVRAEAADRVLSLGVSTIEKDIAMMGRTLRRGQIPAPIDGVLTFILTDIGSQVGSGTKVAVVSDLSEFKIEGQVAEGMSDRIGTGATVTARIGNVDLTGKVVNITPQSVGGTIGFTVNLDKADHPRLRSGLRTELYVTFGYKDNVMRIPNGPYFKGAGEYDLFVGDEGDNRLVRRKVRLGDSSREYVEVVSGLSPGQRVAVGDMEIYQKEKSIKIK